jgi:hypothetical protein
MCMHVIILLAHQRVCMNSVHLLYSGLRRFHTVLNYQYKLGLNLALKNIHVQDTKTFMIILKE